MPPHDAIVIRIMGDSGDGVQLVGEQLTIAASLAGHDVRTLPDFPAEIRAPAGTVAGVSGFQLAMAENQIFTAGESLDVLVALNPAALKKSLPYLKQGGLLIINEDSLSPKDWEKAQAKPQLLTDAKAHYQVVILPLITYTLQALEGLDISASNAKKTKNCYVLGLVLWLFDLKTDFCLAFIEKKFKKEALIAEANKRALIAGYNYALTLELSRQHFMLGQVTRPEGTYRQITGVEAIALAIAAVATCTKVPTLVAGYPITPASGILHECARLAEFGVQLLQAEDEIAAICACIGAAFGGNLAITCTSGPGFDLKSESLGLAVVAELPLVIIDVQRAGASTGMPTKTGQSDLNQALYGRHGEAPLPVLAAISPSDCFTTIIEAFKIAVDYMTPVVVLVDAYLANAAEPWQIPALDDLAMPVVQYNRFVKPYERDEKGARSWNIPGTPGFIHQLGGLEKQGDMGQVSYDPENHQHMVNLRAKKITHVASQYQPLIIEGDENAALLLIGWGSTYGALKSAMKQCMNEGLSVAWLHLRYLWPLPEQLGFYLKHYQHIVVAELNTGHLCQLLRATYLVNAQGLHQCSGQPFTSGAIVEVIKHAINPINGEIREQCSL